MNKILQAYNHVRYKKNFNSKFISKKIYVLMVSIHSPNSFI